MCSCDPLCLCLALGIIVGRFVHVYSLQLLNHVCRTAPVRCLYKPTSSTRYYTRASFVPRPKPPPVRIAYWKLSTLGLVWVWDRDYTRQSTQIHEPPNNQTRLQKRQHSSEQWMNNSQVYKTMNFTEHSCSPKQYVSCCKERKSNVSTELKDQCEGVY